MPVWQEGWPGEPLGSGHIHRLIKKESKNPLDKLVKEKPGAGIAGRDCLPHCLLHGLPHRLPSEVTNNDFRVQHVNCFLRQIVNGFLRQVVHGFLLQIVDGFLLESGFVTTTFGQTLLQGYYINYITFYSILFYVIILYHLLGNWLKSCSGNRLEGNRGNRSELVTSTASLR